MHCGMLPAHSSSARCGASVWQTRPSVLLFSFVPLVPRVRGDMLAGSRQQFRTLLRHARTFASEAETQIENKLKAALQTQNNVKVIDTSGGCGTMFNLEITAEEFRGKSIVAQHKLVAEILKDDVKTWHGFTLDTRIPRGPNAASS